MKTKWIGPSEIYIDDMVGQLKTSLLVQLKSRWLCGPSEIYIDDIVGQVKTSLLV